MIASDLLDVQVVTDDGQEVGWTVDLRLVLDGKVDGSLPRPRLAGLVVSPRTRTSYLGFERSQVNRPWPLAQLLARLHRGTFLVRWEDVVGLPTPDDRRDPERVATIVLRRGFDRYDARL